MNKHFTIFIMFLSIFGLITISCDSSNKGSNAADEDSDSIKVVQEKPKCTTDNEGKTYYEIKNKILYLCHNGDPVTINTTGAKGDDGDDGKDASVLSNAIINGNMEIAQRGTKFKDTDTNSPIGFYTLDRWAYTRNGIGRCSIEQDADVPNQTDNYYQKSQHSIKISVKTNDAQMNNNDWYLLNYNIEGYDFFPFVGKTATLSFWVKASVPGTYHVGLRNYKCSISYVEKYTIYEKNIWEKKEIVIPFNFSGGDWNFTNGRGLEIHFVLAIDTPHHTTTPGKWIEKNSLSTSDQVNFMSSVDNTIYFTQVQLNEGDKARPFQQRFFQQELALCQRYYEKSYNYEDIPGTATTKGSHFSFAGNTWSLQQSIIRMTVPKRSQSYIITYYNPIDGKPDSISELTYDQNARKIITADSSRLIFAQDQSLTQFQFICNGLLTLNNYYNFHWVVNAELY